MVHTGKIILHVDMNSFYASVEQANNPNLKGKPVAVAGNPKERKGILVTCSYEARARGVYTTMTVAEARRKCPELILLPPNFEIYRHYSQKMFNILRSYSICLEPVSIDEGYLDITELTKDDHAIDIAKNIQQRIFKELDLPCSIGIAPNKFLAKTASDMKKPMGITILRKRDVPRMLWHLPVIEMHGIGESTAKKLNALSIFTIGDLANVSEGNIKMALGKNGIRLRLHANGIDHREVDPDSIYDTKSVGNSITLPNDETNLLKLRLTIDNLSAKVADRLHSKRLAGTTVILSIRSADWHNQTRSKTISNPIYSKQDIFEIAWTLFEKLWDGFPVRLLGVTVSNVIDVRETTQQLSIFNFEEHVKEEPLLKVMNQIEKKFGKGSIKRGIDIGKHPNYSSQTSFSKDFLDDHR